jgi:N-acetylmuramoyl-L-alanine amidase
MAITPDLWFDWAERVPGPPNKTNGGWNPAAGIVGHSAEGGEAYLRSYNENWADPRSASWIGSNLYSGHLLQHYPLSAQCWTSGCAYGNNQLLGIEHEGFAGEMLTYAQQQTLARIIREVSELRGWVPARQVTLWEHNEMANFGAAPTACPSSRIPWYDVLALMYPPAPPAPPTIQEVQAMGPYVALWIQDSWYVVVIRHTDDSNLWSRWWYGGGWSDWVQLPGGRVSGDPQMSVNSQHAHVTASMADGGDIGHWAFAGGWSFERIGGYVVPQEAPRGRGGPKG